LNCDLAQVEMNSIQFFFPLVPAKAGTQDRPAPDFQQRFAAVPEGLLLHDLRYLSWVPAFAGMSGVYSGKSQRCSRVRAVPTSI
jgi:hypothetical protein